MLILIACQHIPHTTDFDMLVELEIFCGCEDLKNFLDKTGRNAVCTSHVALVEFIEALGIWVEEYLLKWLCQASYFSIMAENSTDIVTIVELSLFCQWEKEGVTEEHFLEIIVDLKKADAESTV